MSDEKRAEMKGQMDGKAGQTFLDRKICQA